MNKYVDKYDDKYEEIHDDIHDDIHFDIHDDIHADIHDDIHADIHVDIHSDIHADIHVDIHFDIHDDIHTYFILIFISSPQLYTKFGGLFSEFPSTAPKTHSNASITPSLNTLAKHIHLDLILVGGTRSRPRHGIFLFLIEGGMLAG